MAPCLTWTYPNGCFPNCGSAGRPDHPAGPDFRDALLEVEWVGLVQGDVEIHVRQRD